ncbi:sugar phosphate isomerase/epimerase family protein [Siminovitchia terrae]|uniref:sugar phosphate isomerase/epimerase family protein n=1 Tax=Siminovitchia terrae TaxID=1914933 RepID=UPI0028A9E0CA|nr:TIM barrel protein [Siminovitchia terrae]
MSKYVPFTLSGLSDEAGPSLDQQIRAHLELGWEELELRSLHGVPFYKWDDATFDDVQKRLTSAGLRVSAVASCIANWQRPITAPFHHDVEELKVISERMQTLGAMYVRVMSYPNDGLSEDEWHDRVIWRMHLLTEEARASGIVLLHENCSGWGGASAENTLYLLKEINSPALRLLFDIGNGISYRYDAHQFLQKVWPYVEHVHVKDGVLEHHEVIYTLPGKGQSKVRECIEWLIDHQYRGILAIEPHLHLIPHLNKQGDENDLIDSYITYGRHLEKLLTQILSNREEERAFQ